MTVVDKRFPKLPASGSPSAKEQQAELNDSERILLESACVDLIGRLEYSLEQANREREEGFLGESAVIGNDMLLSVVDFSDGYLTGQRLELVYSLLAEGYKATQLVIDLATSQNWGIVKKIIGQDSATDEQVAQSHKEAGEAIASVLSASIGGGIRLLDPNSPVAKNLMESLQPILVELREKW